MRTARSNTLHATRVGLALAAVALLFAACKRFGGAGVASVGSTMTATQSAFAGAGGRGGVSASAGIGAPSGGPQSVIVMAPPVPPCSSTPNACAPTVWSTSPARAPMARSRLAAPSPGLRSSRRQTRRAENRSPTVACPPTRSRHRASPSCSNYQCACAPMP